MDAQGKDAVLDALRGVYDPCSIVSNVPMDVVEMGLVQDVSCDADGRCTVSLVLTSLTCFQVPQIEQAIEDAILQAGLARQVEVAVDHGRLWSPEMMAERTRERIDGIRQASRAATGVRRRQWKEEIGAAADRPERR